MPINLTKGQKVSLTKGNPGLKKITTLIFGRKGTKKMVT